MALPTTRSWVSPRAARSQRSNKSRPACRSSARGIPPANADRDCTQKRTGSDGIGESAQAYLDRTFAPRTTETESPPVRPSDSPSRTLGMDRSALNPDQDQDQDQDPSEDRLPRPHWKRPEESNRSERPTSGRQPQPRDDRGREDRGRAVQPRIDQTSTDSSRGPQDDRHRDPQADAADNDEQMRGLRSRRGGSRGRGRRNPEQATHPARRSGQKTARPALGPQDARTRNGTQPQAEPDGNVRGPARAPDALSTETGNDLYSPESQRPNEFGGNRRGMGQDQPNGQADLDDFDSSDEDADRSDADTLNGGPEPGNEAGPERPRSSRRRRGGRNRRRSPASAEAMHGASPAPGDGEPTAAPDSEPPRTPEGSPDALRHDPSRAEPSTPNHAAQASTGSLPQEPPREMPQAATTEIGSAPQAMLPAPEPIERLPVVVTTEYSTPHTMQGEKPMSQTADPAPSAMGMPHEGSSQTTENS